MTYNNQMLGEGNYCTLTPLVLVRIQVPQPLFSKQNQRATVSEIPEIPEQEAYIGRTKAGTVVPRPVPME
jgi:hypothetical protein